MSYSGQKGSGNPEEEGQHLIEHAKLEEISRLLKGKEPCAIISQIHGTWLLARVHWMFVE